MSDLVMQQAILKAAGNDDDVMICVVRELVRGLVDLHKIDCDDVSVKGTKGDITVEIYDHDGNRSQIMQLMELVYPVVEKFVFDAYANSCPTICLTESEASVAWLYVRCYRYTDKKIEFKINP